jgi:transcriptional regulator with XRE-family HTH domain
MSGENVTIGERIHRLRVAKGYALAEVASKAGMSEKFLADIENRLAVPPLGDIVSLANVFQVTVGEIFGDQADSPFCLVRSESRPRVPRFSATSNKTGGYTYESLGYQKQNRQMEPFLVTLAPTEVRQTEPNQHAGEEILFVLEGRIKVELAEHTDILNPGDSIYYDSTLPHIVSCHGDSPARILAIIYAKKEMIIF